LESRDHELVGSARRAQQGLGENFLNQGQGEENGYQYDLKEKEIIGRGTGQGGC